MPDTVLRLIYCETCCHLAYRRVCCFAFSSALTRITSVTFVIRKSGSSSLPSLPALPYTHAGDTTRGDAMFSGAEERESYSKVPTYPDLAGKVAVVTGGSGGIGAATCRLLAANGVKVAVNGRDQARIDTVVDAIRATGGEAIGVAGDVTDHAAVEELRGRAEDEFGPTDLLFAFAGGSKARP